MKKTAANHLLLSKAKNMFNGKIYRRISDLVNQGKTTYDVVDWIVMQYNPDVRQSRKQEWCQMLGLTCYALNSEPSPIVQFLRSMQWTR